MKRFTITRCVLAVQTLLCICAVYIGFVANFTKTSFVYQARKGEYINEIAHNVILTEVSSRKINSSLSNFSHAHVSSYRKSATDVNDGSHVDVKDLIGPQTLYVTAKLKQRLGNQMFIYASLVCVAESQGRVPFVDHGKDLDKIFQITHFKKNINTTGWTTIRESGYALFKPELMSLPKENVTMSGSFQSWKYFHNVCKDIKREYTLHSRFKTEAEAILSKYRIDKNKHVLVGVHIRRGDFLSDKNRKYGYGVAKASYFTKAIAKMKSFLPNKTLTFLAASEDLEWCAKNLNYSDVIVLPSGGAFLHFAVLLHCDHMIISSGTFGWWMAYLTNEITIYFKDFVIKNTGLHRRFREEDYYLPGWIGMDN